MRKQIESTKKPGNGLYAKTNPAPKRPAPTSKKKPA